MARYFHSRTYKVLVLSSTWSLGVIFFVFSFILANLTQGLGWAIYNFIAMLLLSLFIFFTGAWATKDTFYIVNKEDKLLVIRQLWLSKFEKVARSVPFVVIRNLSLSQSYFHNQGYAYNLDVKIIGTTMFKPSFSIFRAGGNTPEENMRAREFAQWLAKSIGCSLYD